MNKHIQLSVQIPEHMAGWRLDRALAELLPEYSRARLQAWIRDQQVSLNGQSARQRHPVQSGDTIVIDAQLAEQDVWKAQKIDIDVVFEDEHCLVVNKAPGCVVHPAAGNYEGTLVNALLHHCPDLATLPRAGLIHRLDKDTSGLLVVAKTLAAHTSLVNQLQARSMKREYLALVYGVMTAGGHINAPIGRHPRQRLQMAVVPSGKAAVTHYRIQQRFIAHTLLDVSLETGRTHQIRVHLAYQGYPIVGDPLYAQQARTGKGLTETVRNAVKQFKRQALHAQQLSFAHPETDEIVTFAAALPSDFAQLLTVLRDNQAN